MSTILENEAFIEKINNLVTEIEQYKENSPKSWKDSYEFMLSDLQNILTIADGSIEDAKKEFTTSPLAIYPSFKQYLMSTDIKTIQEEGGATQRTKSSRAKKNRSYLCKECSKEMIIDGNEFKCTNCGYSVEIKASKTKLNITASNRKHSEILLNTITGRGNPPRSVLKVMDHLVVWLTDLHYIKDWLSTHPKRYEKFQKKYVNSEKASLPEDFFDRVIERKPRNLWKFSIYHMFIDEFQQMLEEAKSKSIKKTNMWYLDAEEVLEIVKRYAETFGTENVPGENAKTPDGYDIGNYFLQISLIADQREGVPKEEIEEIYGKKLTMPGLSFNFLDTFKSSDTMVRPYALLQCNGLIQRKVFNIPPLNIPNADLTAMLNIIIAFNNYHKEETLRTSGNSCNSPLYAVAFKLILRDMSMFEKYEKDINKFLPSKQQNTSNEIEQSWLDFMQKQADLIKQYTSEALAKASEPADVTVDENDLQLSEITKSNSPRKRTYYKSKPKAKAPRAKPKSKAPRTKAAATKSEAQDTQDTTNEINIVFPDLEVPETIEPEAQQTTDDNAEQSNSPIFNPNIDLGLELDSYFNDANDGDVNLDSEFIL